MRLPRLLIDFSCIVGIVSPDNLKCTFSIAIPFFWTSDRDFDALKLILAHVTRFSMPFKTYLAPIVDVFVMVISSI